MSIAGEDGEHESLALDPPMHSKPLRIDSAEREWKRGAGTMKVASASLDNLAVRDSDIWTSMHTKRHH